MRVLSRKKGFTLTEILVSILIIGIVMSAVMTLLVSVFKSYEFHQDIMEAKQRGQIALNAIEPLVVNAGLGMPTASDDFMEVFKDNKKIIVGVYNDKTDKRNFTGPVQIAEVNGGVSEAVLSINDGRYSGDSLWLVYGVQSGYGVDEVKDLLADFTSGDITIEPDNYISLNNNIKANDKSALKNWVVFPVSNYPLSIFNDDLTDNKLSVDSSKKQDIYRYDELHYVRAAKIRIKNRNLVIDYLMDLTENYQPVTEGIDAMWCIFEPFDDDGEPSRLLTVTVLARADTMRPELNITAVEGWDTANWGAIPDARYRYAVVSRSWRIRN